MGDEPGSPAGSDRGSVYSTLSTKPDMAVEQQILSRVAFVCNPPVHKLPANPLVGFPPNLSPIFAPILLWVHGFLGHWWQEASGLSLDQSVLQHLDLQVSLMHYFAQLQR